MIHESYNMPTAAVIDTMSARSSISPTAMEEEEPRKKGARGGKRSVSHLSKAQLARKRANDREAQRNIRQRTKEHIENLEKKVKELEAGHRASSMERVLKRNKELEREVAHLQAQVAAKSSSARGSIGPEDALGLARPGEWIQETPMSTVWQAHTLVTSSPQQHGFPATNSNLFENEEVLTPTSNGIQNANPVWEDPTVFGNTSQALAQPTPAWAPFHPAFNQPSRFADLQPSGFTEIVNQPTYQNTTCWQSQPSVYAWQISTKLKAPVTLVDQLMFSVIHSQRHLALHSEATGDDLLGPSFPPVHIIFNHQAPITSSKPPSNITEVMSRYSEVLSKRGFALIPEKLASFMCMYRFVQWQISPTYQTYQKLHDWQAPRPAQLAIPHPAWMDLPPWGKVREMMIENQERYDNPEFQNDYASNLSVNFPHDPMKALIFEDGQIMVSPLMERHLSDINNMSMKKPFADKYPEFRDACRFEEV
ncbi:hypothetical protein HYALB_00012957 [Hymenoscyphus albidus]|uniref:BZIP domain-containing protein n=1 Tax=Hymenoscyphus albidus TaxID=595503 RepID=A0A9N9QAR5_9HELO|nr:hypothetical protein HYALB_00012957 [Hymenoscyphus albidus]